MDLHHVVEDARARDQQQQQQLVLRERGLRIKAAAEQWGRALGRRRALVVLPSEEEETSTTGKRRRAPKEASPPLEAGRGDHHHEEEEEDDDEAVAVEEKVALLRQLVPGGEDMAVEVLLEETADYIAALKAQVGVMRALTCLLLSAGSSDLDAALADAAARVRVVGCWRRRRPRAADAHVRRFTATSERH